MATELSEHVSLTITVDSVGIAREGFGTALILSHSASWVERLRYYGSLVDVANDFAVGTPEYLAAQALFAQTPHPTQIAIGRAALKPTQQYQMSAAQVSNTYTYAINVSGPGITAGQAAYTSDGSATTQKIHNGLVAALNAVVGKNYTASFAPLTFSAFAFTTNHAVSNTNLLATAHGMNTGDGPVELTNVGGALPTGLTAATDYWIIKVDANTFQLATSLANALAGTPVTFSADGTGTNDVNPDTTLSPVLPFLVTGSAAGNWFALEAVNPGVDLKTAQIHADPGVATDLNAIVVEQSDWYALVTTFNSKLYVEAAAAWTESNGRVYIPDVVDSDSIKLAQGGGDTLDALNTLAYNRTAGLYHPRPAEMAAAAWFGRVLPLDPGQDDWKWKVLAGVSPVKLTSTDRANLRAKHANAITSVAKKAITWEGTVAGGNLSFIDVTRGLDWIQDDMSKAVFGAFVGADKVPYDNAGIGVVENEIRGSIKRATNQGILSPDFEPIVLVPRVADVSSSDKALRNLPNVKWNAQLAGAIHKVVIAGTVVL